MRVPLNHSVMTTHNVLSRDFHDSRLMNLPTTDQATAKNCSQCGAPFGCGASSPDVNCWCVNLKHVGPVAGEAQDCLCPRCLAEAIAKMALDESRARERQASGPSPAVSLVEGEDYYLEGAAMVFTTSFLLRRGYCCESGCRHCPFDVVTGQTAAD
jgi:hypothetical protein